MTIHDSVLTHIDDDACRRFQWAIELVGKRWNSGIMLALSRGATRFSEITEMVTGLSDRLLAQRLRELETARLIEREVLPTTPVQVRYRLTQRGAELLDALAPVTAWEHRWN